MRNKSFIKHIREAKEEGRQEGVDFAVVNYSAALLLCLKDKFDFTTEQLEEVAVRVNEMFNDICNGLLSLEDIVKVLKEEDNIDLLVNGKNPYVNQRRKVQPVEFQVVTSEEEDYRQKYLGTFEAHKENSFIEAQVRRSSGIMNDEDLRSMLSDSDDFKDELEKNLRKAGYLDE